MLGSPYYLVAAVLDPQVAHTLTSEQLREGVALMKKMAAPAPVSDQKFELIGDAAPPVNEEVARYVRKLSELARAAAAEAAAVAAAKAAGGDAGVQTAAAAALPGAELLRAARDVVAWWSCATDLPLLRVIFRRVGMMQVSSIASERVFSRLKLLLGRLRHGLADDRVNMLVVSGANYRGLIGVLGRLHSDTTEEDIEARQALWDEEEAIAAASVAIVAD